MALRRSDQISAREIRAQLERMTSSEVFLRSDRMKRFLSFIVEERLARREDELKEYTIALAVFDKPSSFDPRLDPIVRVEAGRLRSKIREYYETVGRADTIGISFPKRSYSPVFERREPFPADNDGTEGSAVSELAAPESGGETPQTRNSVAVLPFTDLSARGDQEYFCDGLTAEIVSALSRVQGLHVAAQTSVMRYKERPADVRRVGVELGVSAVLEGSVRRAGKRLRVTAQLVNIADGYNLWSEVYDSELRDIFEVQLAIAQSIVRALRVRLIEDTPLISLRSGTRSPEAYRLYLKGRYQWNRRTNEGLRRAVRHYQEAIRLDSNYALAYAGLADCYATMGWLGVLSPAAARARASEMFGAALAADPDLAEAHTSRACVDALFDWNWKEAERGFRRALELHPDYETARHWYAFYCLVPQQRLEEADDELRQALQLDPGSAAVIAHLGWILQLRGDIQGALDHYERHRGIAGDFPLFHWYEALAYLASEQWHEAGERLQAAQALTGDEPLVKGTLGFCQARMGNQGEARSLLQRLERSRRRPYSAPLAIATIHLGLGESEDALRWFERALEARCSRAIHLGVDPLCASVRSEDRFQRLLSRMSLAERS